jgi:hypothetical protein
MPSPALRTPGNAGRGGAMNGGSCRPLADAVAGIARRRGPAAARAAAAAEAADTADAASDAATDRAAGASGMAGAIGVADATRAIGAAGRADSAGAMRIGVGCTGAGARVTPRSAVEIPCIGKSRASRLRRTPTKRAWRGSPLRALER